MHSDIFLWVIRKISISCHIFIYSIWRCSDEFFKTISKTVQYEQLCVLSGKRMLALAQNVSGEKVKFETNINYQIKLNPKKLWQRTLNLT